jgi:NADPH-dependent glutamate synthase beta chain and related oxidoreductases
MTLDNNAAQVAIIGAGPAGLFAAKQLAEAGIHSILLNRDIKPGGLAEYGIYPDKLRIKEGLRTQFTEILHNPLVTYFGNVSVGTENPLKLADLRSMGFAATLIAAGAQSTKRLGLPGEDCPSVYHAKELVYHYNHLPPYATQSFPIGKKVIVVGVGNVMTDIVRYLLTQPQVQEITTIARRGLAEVKFDRAELKPIVGDLDYADFEAEVARIAPIMQAIGQDPAQHLDEIAGTWQSAEPKSAQPKWHLRFLSSPSAILCDQGILRGVRLEENRLEAAAEGTTAIGTGHFIDLPADTLVFAIGDQVDGQLGLPMSQNQFPLSQRPLYPVGNAAYELQGVDEKNGPTAGTFVCGWSRNASSGMVGIARKEGNNAAKAIQAYLQAQGSLPGVDPSTVAAKLSQAGYTAVQLADLGRLEAVEKEKAQALGLSEFKFDTAAEMLQVMGLSK